MNKIPLYKPYVSKKEVGAALRVLRSGKLSRGQETEDFEKRFAKCVGKKYAVAVNSGTSGLHVLVRVMGWKDGDEVITTPFSYIASANSLLFEKVKPVFVDIDPQTLNIDPKKIEKKINKKTKGLLVVDIFGLPANYKEIRKIADRYKLGVIEDACEAIGKPNRDFMVGNLGDAAVYGFHENKQLTTAGEGGMIVTDDLNIAEKCRSMRDQGRSNKKDWINNVMLGFNFRMTEIQAAFGSAQLSQIDKILRKRESIAKKYSESLRDLDLILPSGTPDKRSWFFYYVMFKDNKTRDRIHDILLSKGISSSKNYFPPIYNFPMYKKYRVTCPNTETVSQTLLVLPMYFDMTMAQVDAVCRIIRETLKKYETTI